MAESKIVTMLGGEVNIYRSTWGEMQIAIVTLFPMFTLDRANAKLLHEALGRALETDGKG